MHCQRIHYFALRNLPFRRVSKSLTDALGCRSHKNHACIRAKHFRLSLQQIFNTAPNDASPRKSPVIVACFLEGSRTSLSVLKLESPYRNNAWKKALLAYRIIATPPPPKKKDTTTTTTITTESLHACQPRV